MREEETLEERGERNFTPVAGNFTLLLGQVSKAQLVLVENVVPVREFSSPSLKPPFPPPFPRTVLALKACYLTKTQTVPIDSYGT